MVSSCDKYEDAWEPFFRLLKIQWPECCCDIVLLSETKTFTCDYLNVKTINSDPQMPWSTRIKNALSQIKTEYVLFFLEDFFLLKEVNTDILISALAIMNKRKDLFLIEFPSVEPGYEKPDKINASEMFRKVPRFEAYRAKVMVSLWRKDDFQKLLFENENPWICEKETSIRTMAYSKKIYRQDYSLSVPAFYYHINPKCGYGITGGKWLKNNKPFFEKNGISGVNYENLGIEESAQTYRQLAEAGRKEKQTQLKELKRKRNIKELLFVLKRNFIKTLKIDLLCKILKYRKVLKK